MSGTIERNITSKKTPPIRRGVDLTDWAAVFTIASALAVVITLVVFVLQLRINTRAIQQNLAVSLLSHLTSETFARRRKHLYDISGKYSGDWSNYFESLDDFECRSFAYTYEMIGQMVDRKVIDYDLAKDILQFSIWADWRKFEPIDNFLKAKFDSRDSEWRHFGQLS